MPNPRGLVRALMQYNESQPAYIGCMKAGPVVNDWKSPWYEPQGWKFGGSGSPGADRFYMLHASANGYALTRNVAMHIAHFGDVLAVRSDPLLSHFHPSSVICYCELGLGSYSFHV